MEVADVGVIAERGEACLAHFVRILTAATPCAPGRVGRWGEVVRRTYEPRALYCAEILMVEVAGVEES